MSRIGKKLISVPSNVQVLIVEKLIKVVGKYGSLEKKIFDNLIVVQEGNELNIRRNLENRKVRALHGLMRTLVQNMIEGVTQQFSKTLIVEGVGYKFLLNPEVLVLNIGFTNPLLFKIPENLNITLQSPTRVVIAGIAIDDVGLFAAKIRSARPPEPYKGKGIRYLNEIIRRKIGKSGKSGKSKKK